METDWRKNHMNGKQKLTLGLSIVLSMAFVVSVVAGSITAFQIHKNHQETHDSIEVLRDKDGPDCVVFLDVHEMECLP